MCGVLLFLLQLNEIKTMLEKEFKINEEDKRKMKNKRKAERRKKR